MPNINKIVNEKMNFCDIITSPYRLIIDLENLNLFFCSLCRIYEFFLLYQYNSFPVCSLSIVSLFKLEISIYRTEKYNFNKTITITRLCYFGELIDV